MPLVVVMRIATLTLSLALVSIVVPAAQEREVPKDSARLTMSGCSKGRAFVVRWRADHEPVTSDVAEGRRFRLSGEKKMLDDIKHHEPSMVEITGLVRQADLVGSGGVPIAGGRVRIGGGVPQSPVSGQIRDPIATQAVIDVESWRPLPDGCPGR